MAPAGRAARGGSGRAGIAAARALNLRRNLPAPRRVSTFMDRTYLDFNRSLIDDIRAHAGQPSGGPFKGRNMVILTTRGAKSGEIRENPLVYSTDGDKIVIIASKGGAPTHPSWYHNLVAHPDVTVEIGGEKFKAHAHVAGDAEYERLYQQHASLNPAFHDYRKKTSRKIPVVVLEKLGKG